MSSNPDSKNESPEGSAAEDFAALLEASEEAPRQRVSEGDLVSGEVIAIGQSAAFVAIGGKGEASIDVAEFRDPETGEIQLAVGDRVEATVVDDGSRGGSVVLKRVLGRGGHAAEELLRACEHGIPVEGLVTAEVKAGFDVQIGGLRAFCPGSQIDLRRGGERIPGAAYVGQRFPFRVIKVESEGRNIVVSRRQLLAEEAAAQAERTWETLQVGAVVRGTVRSLRDFGAFVDVGGVDGLIPISELGFSRVKHPSDVLEVGQHVEVQVIRVEEQTVEGKPPRKQVALSLKALADDPWAAAPEKFPPGSAIRGTVRRVESFGAFVEVEPGLEGLVHISKLVLDRRLSHARQAVSVGDAVDVVVLAVDPGQRRMSLSMVESAKRERDAEVIAERGEQDAALQKTNQRKSLGTFADLLGSSKRDRS